VTGQTSPLRFAAGFDNRPAGCPIGGTGGTSASGWRTAHGSRRTADGWRLRADGARLTRWL